MQEYNVVETEQTRQGVIIHKVARAGKLESVYYTAIRAGLSWPSPEAPGFYIILAQDHLNKTRFKDQPQQKGKLRFLKEYECPGVFLDKLCAVLTDDCTLYRCATIYADVSEEYEQNAEFFRQWAYDKHVTFGRDIEEAPYAKNFSLGISLIRHWLTEGLLEIPKGSVCHRQLKHIERSKIDNLPIETFYGIEALRHVLGSFHKYSPMPGRSFQPRRKRSLGVGFHGSYKI
jgi:hypothetical protein